MRFLFLFLSFFFVSQCFSQRTLWFSNGITKQVIEYKFDTIQKKIYYTDFSSKRKTSANLDNLFALVDREGNEIAVYQPDTFENAVSYENMRYYVYGLHDARLEYSAGFPFVTGFVLGVSTPFLFNFWAPLFPTTFSTTLGLLPEKKLVIDNQSAYYTNDFYVEGYKDAVRNKRVKNSLFGGITGLVIGFLAVKITR